VKPAGVTAEEYLSTSYDPDMEYVDGVLVDRNVGEVFHSLMQSNLILALHRRLPHFKALPSVRCQTAETRFRLPDIAVILAAPATRYLVEPPFLAIEIISDEDRMTYMMEKLHEYERKGIPNIWLIDPRLKTMSVYAAGNLYEVREDIIATFDGRIQLSREEIFQD
jgi:Uma2 family endonuclease